ncbi:radical SAM protein [Chakrabartyella piscis]|uniref:radical SAM protein n=1 Tax=Chakrabartyella piscis TaxID=2918914 RepID=UPI002958706E|nr:radical SAM protein [Chakrabartyella piscis]
MCESTIPTAYCSLCPRHCSVNRSYGEMGFCRSLDLPKVSLVSTHMWEEPPISGTNGSGTVFFANCNLRCVFCQNHDISDSGYGLEIPIERLAEIFLEQQAKGLNNLNLVSPTQYGIQVREALILAKNNGLTLPVVYNTNGYEFVDFLQSLEGLVDVYLPDFKYMSCDLAGEYSGASDYPEKVKLAILEMKRQQPKDVFVDGLLKKGIIVRHLVLPNHYKDSLQILDWIVENLGTEAYVSLLNQYTPMHKAKEIPALSRRLTTFEYQKVTTHFLDIGLKNGFIQKRSSATSDYTPIFDLTGVANCKNRCDEEENSI